MRDLVIFGSGGLAREVAQVVRDLNAVTPTWSLAGFLDDDSQKHGRLVGGLKVLGGTSWWERHRDVAVAIGIGNTCARRHVANRLAGADFATLIHPRAWLGERVVVGAGTIIFPNVTATCDVVFGHQVLLNPAVTVGHDAHLDDFVTVAPSVSISGAVRVGVGCDLGTGACVIQNIRIGAWSIVGAGAVVVRDLPENVTAVGAPARVIKTREPGWHGS